MRVNGRVTDDIQSECRLSHGRTRADKHEIRRLQACCKTVQIGKTGRHSGDPAAVAGELFDIGIGFQQNVMNVLQSVPVLIGKDLPI